MKKLNLKKLKLVTEEVLQRTQLATIYGGSGSGGGGECVNTVTCVDGTSFGPNTGSCPASTSEVCKDHGGIDQCTMAGC